MKKLLLTAATVAALTLCVTGCHSHDGGTGGDAGGAEAGPSGAADPFNNVIKYAECLQKQGLKVKIHPGDGYTMPKDTDPDKIKAAEAACRSEAPPGMYRKPSTEELDRHVKVAKCLRDQGVQVEDPTEDRPQLAIKNPPDNLKQLQEDCEAKVKASD